MYLHNSCAMKDPAEGGAGGNDRTIWLWNHSNNNAEKLIRVKWRWIWRHFLTEVKSNNSSHVFIMFCPLPLYMHEDDEEKNVKMLIYLHDLGNQCNNNNCRNVFYGIQ